MPTVIRRLDTRTAQASDETMSAMVVLGARHEIGEIVVALHPERVFHAKTLLWQEETRGLSSMARISRHPAYAQIVAMGAQMVPLVLGRIASGDRAPWWPALRQMTGENPVPVEDAGKPERMAHAWLLWGQAKGLLP